MRTIKPLTILFVTLGFAVLSSAAFAQQDGSQNTGDPVADAARKAREEQKKAGKPKKVFTDDDVVTKAETSAPVAAAGDAKPEAASVTGKSEAAKPDSAETTWRKRFAEQRRKIADAEEALSVLEREAEKADIQYYSDPQKALQEQYTRKEINDKNAAIAAKKKEIADLKQQLNDLEDELRRQGGDPGWAR